MHSDSLSNTPDFHVYSLVVSCVDIKSKPNDLIFLFNVVLFQKVTFQQHLVNTQNDFDLALGVFTARVAGVYYFNFHSMSKVGHRRLHRSFSIQLHEKNLHKKR